jgi:hypothetical protein
MGIRFQCPACGAKLNVKSELSGKRGVCPKCQAKIQIPAESIEAAESSPAPAPAGPVVVSSEDRSVPTPVPPPPPTPVVSAAPKESKWFVRPPSGGQYGPAAEGVLRQWITEGRITPDTLVWREGDPEWLKASAAFPELAAIVAPVVSGADVVRPVSMGPTIGPSTAAPMSTVAGSTEFDAAAAATAMLMARRKRARSTGLMIMGVLIVAVLILLPILIYVLMSSGAPPEAPPTEAAWRRAVVAEQPLMRS